MPPTGGTSTLINPATEESFATAAVSGTEDVDRAMQAAAAAFETWRDARRPSGSWLCSSLQTPWSHAPTTL